MTKPTLKEIVTEMSKDFCQSAKKTGKDAGDVAILSGVFLLSPHVAPYMIPTVIRECKEPGPGPTGRTYNAGKTFFTIGFAASLMITYDLHYEKHFAGYAYAMENGHPEVLALPVVTNIGSLLYEAGRKARKKLIARHERVEFARREERLEIIARKEEEEARGRGYVRK